MKTPTKLPAGERRAAILKAVRRVFAEKGFDGTTTRELADAAGVSEGLLFKHFPNKEALFTAMQLACCNEQDHETFSRLRALEPSASTLVLLVHFLVSRVLGTAARGSERAIHGRLMLRSLAEDGDFARTLLARVAADWVPKIEDCLRAAAAAGDLVGEPVLPGLRAWFAHHLAVLAMYHLLPSPPAVDYGVPTDRLVDQAVRFALRGMGLKEEAIRRYYTARVLAAAR